VKRATEEEVMKVVLVRHGEAEVSSESGKDIDRSLTDYGKNDIHRLGMFMNRLFLKYNFIFHSPYLRTEQTAQILFEDLQKKQPMEIFPADELAPDNDYERIYPKLKNFTNSDSVIIVGHNPNICYLGSRLISGNDVLAPNLNFLPGTALALNVSKEYLTSAQILWMVSSKELL
ncbi:MAG TPA: phosphohistidine phosphatase SixA, partial [Leptospiraceae bacterium]|nr:phosphohistidine phosphatase SixA [Leptospiraceae bacterium]